MIALVPTCNRPELFLRLVSKLNGFSVFGFVNNTTPANLVKYREMKLPPYAKLIFTDISGDPKKCHVKTFRLMLSHVAGECLVIEDDVYPCNNFYYQLTSQVLTIKKTCTDFMLSPIYMPNRNSDFYTGGTSREIKIGQYSFIDQAWVDGNFYMTSGVCHQMKRWIKPTIKIFPASSGIGRLNSVQMVKHRWKMYTANPTLVEHLDQPSVMFGTRRIDIPLIAKF